MLFFVTDNELVGIFEVDRDKELSLFLAAYKLLEECWEDGNYTIVTLASELFLVC